MRDDHPHKPATNDFAAVHDFANQSFRAGPSVDPDTIIQVDIEEMWPPPTPPAFGTADLGPTPWLNLNPQFNYIGLEQGVEINSALWLSAGAPAYSGASGGHESYGWSHKHRATPAWIKAAIASVFVRPSFYLNAPFRSFPYESSGRPKGWAPEEPNDLQSGQKLYITSKGGVKVSGLDAEHVWLQPLYAVIDSPSIPVKALGGTHSSVVIAKFGAQFQTRSIVGMVRDSGGGTSQRPYPWTYGDRATGRILHTIIESAKRGCLAESDVETAFYFMRDVMLPAYESTPGIGFFNLQPIPPNHHSIGLFNGVNWLISVCYDAAVALLGSPSTIDLGNRYMKLVERYSQWVLDIEETVPGKGFASPQCFVDRAAFRKGGPHQSIKQLLTPANIRFDNYGPTWKLWAYRAANIAATVTGSSVLAKAADEILNLHGGKPGTKRWLVNADGSYAT